MKLLNFKNINKTKGFSFLELLIVIAIVAIISVTGVEFYFNYSKSVELNSFSNTIVSDLRQAQIKSMSGVGSLKWGIRFTNTTPSDYYEIYSTNTDYSGGSIISKTYLTSSIFFSSPSEGNYVDVVFNKISGSTSGFDIIINSSGISKAINISSVGNISIN